MLQEFDLVHAGLLGRPIHTAVGALNHAILAMVQRTSDGLGVLTDRWDGATVTVSFRERTQELTWAEKQVLTIQDGLVVHKLNGHYPVGIPSGVVEMAADANTIVLMIVWVSLGAPCLDEARQGTIMQVFPIQTTAVDWRTKPTTMQTCLHHVNVDKMLQTQGWWRETFGEAFYGSNRSLEEKNHAARVILGMLRSMSSRAKDYRLEPYHLLCSWFGDTSASTAVQRSVVVGTSDWMLSRDRWLHDPENRFLWGSHTSLLLD